MRAKVVIGAAYGDEGKGQTVHALCSPKSVVVRFNGGCQAGHTVLHRNTRRVFSHLGAGTVKGAKTHLSRFFVCHPSAFLAEWHDLLSNGIYPYVTASPECPVTTVWDVAINRLLEQSRGDGRHGSVGVGFGETLERQLHSEWAMTLGGLGACDVAAWLVRIRDEWVPYRTKQLGLTVKLPEALLARRAVTHQLADFREFLGYVSLVDDAIACTSEQGIVFEGAQGLMLDQDLGQFPHVTRSNTGLHNVKRLTDEPLDVYYVTRAYTTRHGAGPLPYELQCKPYPLIYDDTNVAGPFQGSLRYSYLNLDTLRDATRWDKRTASKKDRFCSVVTCLDQLPDHAQAIYDGKPRHCRASRISRLTAEALDCEEVDYARSCA